MRLAPNAALSFQILGRAILSHLGRFAEAKAIRLRQIDLKLDGAADHRGLYGHRFFRGRWQPVCNVKLDWAKGKPDEYLLLKPAPKSRLLRQMQKCARTYRQAIESAQRGNSIEMSAAITARSAIGEARVGNTAAGTSAGTGGAGRGPKPETLPFAGIALAMAGDVSQANAVADELSKRFPLDTDVNNIWLPLIRAEIELGRGNPAKAVELLQPAISLRIWLGCAAVPVDIRGRAYLKAKQGREAAAEFQKTFGPSPNCVSPRQFPPSLTCSWGAPAPCLATMPEPAPRIRISSRCGKMPTRMSPS